jgi:hypothetical protein
MIDPVQKVVARLLIEAEADAEQERANADEMRAEVKVLQTSMAQLREELARSEGRVIEALARAEAAEGREMPAAQKVDLSPLSGDLKAIKAAVVTLAVAAAMEEKEDAMEFVVERHPIPPGSMLPYGPVKTIRSAKGKA